VIQYATSFGRGKEKGGKSVGIAGNVGGRVREEEGWKKRRASPPPVAPPRRDILPHTDEASERERENRDTGETPAAPKRCFGGKALGLPCEVRRSVRPVDAEGCLRE